MDCQSLEELDDTGKVVLDDVYNQPDPRAYFSTLNSLDYCIPQNAKAIFRKIIDAQRRTRKSDKTTVVDIGCSYGVNAALVKYDRTLDDLFERYCGPASGGFQRSELIARDQRTYAPGSGDTRMEMIGLDAAEKAIEYAREARILDRKIATNLEEHDPSSEDAELLARTDLIISTGCIGYATEKTITRLAQATGNRAWMAHFVLRMFPFNDIRQMLAERGYVTARGGTPFRQRRFASTEERDHVIERLAGLGIDQTGIESDGWLYAELFVSRPADETRIVFGRSLVGA